MQRSRKVETEQLKVRKKVKICIEHSHILYIIKSGTYNSLVKHINRPMINPKNSPKHLNSVLKNNFTMLQKLIKISPIK